MQQHNLESAGPQPPEAVYLSKVADKSAHTVSYSSDIAAGWSTDVKSSKGNGKASVAGSLYLTASDSGSQSGEESVYDAVSLPDSERDLEVEFGAARTPMSSSCHPDDDTCWSKQGICMLSVRMQESMPKSEDLTKQTLLRWCPVCRRGYRRRCATSSSPRDPVPGSWSQQQQCSSCQPTKR